MFSMLIMLLLVILAGWLDSHLDWQQVENNTEEKSS
jgi:hypothetical protein